MSFDDLLKKQYKSQNDKYGGYTFDVQTKDGVITSKVTIDYKKMNLNKYIQDNSEMKSYINKDNNFTLNGVKSMYKALGAECN